MSAPFGPNYPPLVAFLAQLGSERALAQVQIRRIGEGFELRHIADSEAPAESLRQLPLAEAPGWAQTNSTGQFRPLKSAPDLRQGWRLTVAMAAKGPSASLRLVLLRANVSTGALSLSTVTFVKAPV